MILLVEDDEGIRQVMSMVLDNLQLQYKALSNVKDSLAFLENESPSILLVDMLFEDGDAKPIVKLCKDRYPNCKSILYTAWNTADRLANELQVDHLIKKPCNIEEIEELLISLNT